jgi:tRNA U34 2-thiouridine synthase MnmA/TrmU
MRNWDTRDESGTDQGCEWEKDWEDVQRVCKTLDLPCQMVSHLSCMCAGSYASPESLR